MTLIDILPMWNNHLSEAEVTVDMALSSKPGLKIWSSSEMIFQMTVLIVDFNIRRYLVVVSYFINFQCKLLVHRMMCQHQ